MIEFMEDRTSNFYKRNIGIVGCGWLGSRIAEKLSKKSNIYTTTTSKDKIPTLDLQGFNPIFVDFNVEYLSPSVLQWKAISCIDVLIITVPFSLRKENDVNAIQKRIQNLSTFIGSFNRQIFFMSSTSVYPDGQKEFTEDDIPIENVLPEILLRDRYPQVNILRLGGLMGDNRQLCNYTVPNLNAPVNHIHYADVCAVIEKMIDQQYHSKLYNVVAPSHPTKAEVINTQKNISFKKSSVNELGRLISSNKMIVELEYTFKYADPKYFHL